MQGTLSQLQLCDTTQAPRSRLENQRVDQLHLLLPEDRSQVCDLRGVTVSILYVVHIPKSNDKSTKNFRQCTKKERHHFADKGLSSQSYGLSGSHVQM